MFDRLIRRFIAWVSRRAHRRLRRLNVVTFAGDFSFYRFEFLWRDEWPDVWWDKHVRWMFGQDPGSHDSARWTGIGPRRFHRPVWWRPFNAFLHCWRPQHDGEEFHDHPRWTITVVLRGKLIERTPWRDRVLTPGSVVIRSRKAIHAFQVPKEARGRTWTLFIVGRRNHRQNRYLIQAK